MTLSALALVLALGTGMGTAHAGVLTYQDVVFTTTWTNNVLTLEIDAAARSGDWTRATMLGALSLKEIGNFTGFSLTAAPKGVEGWKPGSRELNANGCAGGAGGARAGRALCLSGAPIALDDDMVFTFAFTGTPNLQEPHLKVRFLDDANAKTGSLLSRTITASTVAAAPAPIPVTPPVTAPVATPTPVPADVAVAEPVPAPVPAVTMPAVVSVTPVDTVAVVPAPGAGDFATLPAPVSTLPDAGASAGNAGAAAATAVAVPEPQSFALLLSGLVLMGIGLRRRS